jgi:hypothetical protein
MVLHKWGLLEDVETLTAFTLRDRVNFTNVDLHHSLGAG